MKEKKFTFTIAGRGGGSYTKKESELSANDNYILLANFVNEFNKLPETVKMMFMQQLYQTTRDRQSKELENALQTRETGNNDISEPAATLSDKD